MRQKIFLLLLFFQCGMADSFSQNVAIENLRQNIAYPYIYNPMNIIVEEIPCDEIFVSTNNGEIKSRGNCEYVFYPHEIGQASVFIHKIEKGDRIIFDKVKVLLPGSKEKVELDELIIEIK